jgi:hypothetical protein
MLSASRVQTARESATGRPLPQYANVTRLFEQKFSDSLFLA